jgi:hypothetical protein
MMCDEFDWRKLYASEGIFVGLKVAVATQSRRPYPWARHGGGIAVGPATTDVYARMSKECRDVITLRKRGSNERSEG